MGGRKDINYKLHEGRQGKHIPGDNNFQEKKSPITVSKERLKELFKKYHGTGIKIGNKEVVDFKEYIGIYKSKNSDKGIKTTRGTIHYDSNGNYHIVPAKPKN